MIRTLRSGARAAVLSRASTSSGFSSSRATTGLGSQTVCNRMTPAPNARPSPRVRPGAPPARGGSRVRRIRPDRLTPAPVARAMSGRSSDRPRARMSFSGKCRIHANSLDKRSAKVHKDRSEPSIYTKPARETPSNSTSGKNYESRERGTGETCSEANRAASARVEEPILW